MISSDSRIVIVGDPACLDRLRGELPSSGISLRPIDDFLSAYDRETIRGEEQLRRMEELYSSLRGKLIVRLMLVNLNPEIVRQQGDRLQELAEAWKCIEARLTEFLQERRNEGIDFATILVTEEGDWTKDRKEVIEGFARAPKDSKFIMRCYLMTRLLELGRDRVIHAKDAWPVFVAGLIRHFLWKDRHAGDHSASERKRFFEHSGLYAWRTLKVVAAVPETVVREKTAVILKEVTGKLFGERPEALFPSPLFIDTESAGGFGFEACVQNPFGQAPWNELGMKDDTGLGALEAPAKWAQATGSHAGDERKSAWNERCAESPKPSKSARMRLDEAKEVPGKVFPGSLPSPPVSGLPDVKSVLCDIQERLHEVNRKSSRIRQWWEDHLQAASGFVVTSERLIVGLIVSMALVYGVLSVQMTVQKYLPGSLFPLQRGLLLAMLAVAGVFVMLLVGYLTQRWRGRVAQNRLKALGDEWIKANVAFRQKIADSLRGSRRAGAIIRESAARKQLVKRLSRIEHILTAELQPTSTDDDDGIISLRADEEGDPAQRYRKWLEVKVSASPQTNFAEKDLIEKMTGSFFRGWHSLLDQAGQKVMVPAPAVLELCRRSLGDLRDAVDKELRESAAERLCSEGSDEVQSKLKEVQLDGNERHFYSVDLSGGVPRDWAWYRKGFASVFESSGGFEKSEEVPLKDGSLAVLYGECPLEIIESQEMDRLEFGTKFKQPVHASGYE